MACSSTTLPWRDQATRLPSSCNQGAEKQSLCTYGCCCWCGKSYVNADLIGNKNTRTPHAKHRSSINSLWQFRLYEKSLLGSLRLGPAETYAWPITTPAWPPCRLWPARPAYRGSRNVLWAITQTCAHAPHLIWIKRALPGDPVTRGHSVNSRGFPEGKLQGQEIGRDSWKLKAKETIIANCFFA